MKKQPILYIMTGLPFSGKSTLARIISKNKKTKLLAFDKIWEEEKNSLRPSINPIEEWKQILEIAHKKIKNFLNQGISVVYDDTNAKKEHRDALKKIAQDTEADFKIIYLATPFEELRKRQKNNKNTHKRHDVTDENFQNLVKQFEIPNEEKNVLIFTIRNEIEKFINNL